MAAPQPPAPERLEQLLSVERMGAYRADVGGDLELAIGLYEWNSAVAGAFFEDLGHIEVMLRNALHYQLSAWHTTAGRVGFWYDDPAEILEEHRRKDIAVARLRVCKAGKPETPGRIVAELSFGFWSVCGTWFEGVGHRYNACGLTCSPTTSLAAL